MLFLQFDSTVTQLAISGNFIGRSGIKLITDMLKENDTITSVVCWLVLILNSRKKKQLYRNLFFKDKIFYTNEIKYQ